MNELQPHKIRLKDKVTSALLDELNQCCYSKSNDSFVLLCNTVYNIKRQFDKSFCTCNGEKHIVIDGSNYNGFPTIGFNDLMAHFGLDKTQVSRILSSNEKYISDGKIIPIFYSFSKSKLFELIPVETATLENDIRLKILRPDSTVQTIRKYVKSKTPHQQKEQISPEINENDIPMAYDPKKYYPFNYFETKTQKQLLNMIWELQKKYVKEK